MSWLPCEKKQMEIEEKVLDLSAQLGLYYPDNTLEEFVKRLDLEVYFTEFDKPYINGVIFFHESKEKKTKIFLNSKELHARKSFSLAHKIGHLILHKNESPNYRIYTYEYKDNNDKETEANFFAASLLIPKIRLEYLLWADYSIEMLFKYFGVSKSIIENRLLWLRKKDKKIL